jgi:hypothetical protein
MPTFDELVTSRRQWIEQTLIPWCKTACRKDLQRAELEWLDVAGKVDPAGTLWSWAWARFPALVNDGLRGLDETHAVVVHHRGGREFRGFPDSRRSARGELILVPVDASEPEPPPISIDDVVDVIRAD